MKQEDVKVALIQIRKDSTIRDHERDCIIETTGLTPDQFVVYDVTESPVGAEILADVDAVIIGGDGDSGVLDDLAFKPKLIELVNAASLKNIPLLGICWGGQFLALVLGGTVVRDPNLVEHGYFSMRPTPEAQNDPLCADLPPTFIAQHAHNDSITTLPPGAIHLIASERCHYQAFTIPGKPIYGIQFHAELTKQHIIDRCHLYNARAQGSDYDTTTIEAQATETPEAAALMTRFIDKIVLAR
jgi:GMP synthase (glutamine-hydrolysing)